MWCCQSTLEDSLASKVDVSLVGFAGVDCGSPGTQSGSSERVLFRRRKTMEAVTIK